MKGSIPLGEVIETQNPDTLDVESWVVTSIEPDPNAIWSLSYDSTPEGKALLPEAIPETVLVVLVKP